MPGAPPAGMAAPAMPGAAPGGAPNFGGPELLQQLAATLPQGGVQ
jgi:hypothetical protein